MGFPCPHARSKGDVLWVRECHIWGWPADGGDPQQFGADGNEMPRHIWYRADFDPVLNGWTSNRGALTQGWMDDDGGYKDNIPWTPSIHMPRWACRLTLEVLDVRVERVQDISEEDAVAAGCICRSWESAKHDKRWKADEYAANVFSGLWDVLYAAKGYGWDKNPWVWATTFKVIDKETT